MLSWFIDCVFTVGTEHLDLECWLSFSVSFGLPKLSHKARLLAGWLWGVSREPSQGQRPAVGAVSVTSRATVAGRFGGRAHWRLKWRQVFLLNPDLLLQGLPKAAIWVQYEPKKTQSSLVSDKQLFSVKCQYYFRFPGYIPCCKFVIWIIYNPSKTTLLIHWPYKNRLKFVGLWGKKYIWWVKQNSNIV